MDKNNNEKVIEVSAYSGYKANERPMYFTLDGLKREIINITNRWTEPDKDFFKVLADDGKIYTICWNREKDIWFVFL